MEVVIQPQQVEAILNNKSDSHLRRLLEVLPATAYTCDADGLITHFNQRAVEIWGREPKIHDPLDRY
jgi:two-component system, LuxR family, sensor kinase FixL